jgi:hypothetical protein
MNRFCLRLPLASLIALSLAACQQTQPTRGDSRVIGALELGIGANDLTTQAVLPDSSASFVPITGVSVCDYVPFNVRYVNRSFRFTNLSGGTLSNLTLHAYNKTGNADGTALKNIVDFGGATGSNPRAATPSQGVTCATANVDSLRADLQVFDDATTSTRTTEALAANPALLAAGEYFLQYGYLVQQRGGDTDGDNDPRTIGANETGTVTIALRFDRGINVSTAYNFVMTFLLTSGGDSELVQGLEDQLMGTVAGLSSVPSGVRKVTLPGGQACGDTAANLKFIRDYRKAGQTGGSGADAPGMVTNVTAPASSLIVTSSANSGAGSLRQEMTDAAPDTEICFTSNITLLTELAVTKNLRIYGGSNVTISGGNATRVFRVDSGVTASLGGFTVANGRSVNLGAGVDGVGSEGGGGGIRNAGTLTLNGMKVRDNVYAGTPTPSTSNLALIAARGGGIYNAGTLNVSTTLMSNNAANASKGPDATTGSFGQPGFAGGVANGGGVFNTDTGTLLIADSLITQNSATGGQGGNGGVGQVAPIPNPPCVIQSGNGGMGGNADGGGLYSKAPGTLTALYASVNSNAVTAGTGGVAGGPPPCSTATASSGTATNPDSSLP